MLMACPYDRSQASGAVNTAGQSTMLSSVGPSGVGVSRTDRAWFARGRPEGHDSPVEIPETKYAKTADGIHLAYQVAGDGPIDFVVVGSAFIASVDLSWEFPTTAAITRFFAARGRAVRLR